MNSAVQVHETIQELPTAAFSGNKMLIEVTLPQMLKIIGPEAFLNCSLLKKVRIPLTTCKEIGERAFLGCCSLQEIALPIGLIRVREETFSRCSKLKTMAVPWSVVVIEHGAFSYCTALISVELPPKGLKKIESRAFAHCEQLRNIEIPKSVNRLGDNVFTRCERSLELRFGVNIEALDRRFDDLPLHSVCYYQAHFTLAAKLKRLETAMIQMENPAGARSKRSGGIFSLCRKAEAYDLDIGDFFYVGGCFVDSFAMTPLHILVLSTRPCLSICESLLARYPFNVNTQDRHGNTPIDYACMVNAPIPLMEVLLSTQRHYLNDAFPDEERQRLKSYISIANKHDSVDLLSHLTMRYFHARIKQLGMEEWQQDVVNEIEVMQTLPHARLREQHLELRIADCLRQYERKEALSLLELALWEARMHSEMGMRLPGPSWRLTCQIQCGAEIVIPLVLPYLGDVGAEYGYPH